jgi:hypothetical protein
MKRAKKFFAISWMVEFIGSEAFNKNGNDRNWLIRFKSKLFSEVKRKSLVRLISIRPLIRLDIVF